MRRNAREKSRRDNWLKMKPVRNVEKSPVEIRPNVRKKRLLLEPKKRNNRLKLQVEMMRVKKVRKAKGSKKSRKRLERRFLNSSVRCT
jgi:hypothetical protein